eukprot:jgi/Ulvmu1/4384/UM002_0109.1
MSSESLQRKDRSMQRDAYALSDTAKTESLHHNSHRHSSGCTSKWPYSNRLKSFVQELDHLQHVIQSLRALAPDSIIAGVNERLDAVQSKYLLYIQSLAHTSLEQELDVETLSHQLGLGAQRVKAAMAEKSTHPSRKASHLEAHSAASPATTLWRAAASQWQQASSQWLETDRCTPKARKGALFAGRTKSASFFSPPTYRTTPNEPPYSPPMLQGCRGSDLAEQLKQRFITRTAARTSQSLDGAEHGLLRQDERVHDTDPANAPDMEATSGSMRVHAIPGLHDEQGQGFCRGSEFRESAMPTMDHRASSQSSTEAQVGCAVV